MVIGLLIIKVVSNYLQPEDFAIFSIGSRAANVLAFLMLMGLGIAIPKYIASARAKGDKTGERALFYSAAILMATASAIVFLCVIVKKSLFADIVFGDVAYEHLVIPTLVFAFGVTLSSFVHAYYRAIGKFKQYNGLQVMGQVASLIIVVASGVNIALQFSLRGAAIGLLAATVLGYITIVIYRRKAVQLAEIREKGSDLLGYCLPRVPGEVFLFAYSVVPLIIINSRFGLEITAAFATAVTLQSIIIPLFQVVGTVLLPHVSKSLTLGRYEDIRSKISKLRYIYLGISGLAVIFMLFFADFVISLIFSSEYVGFSLIVKVVFLSVIPYGLYLLVRNPLDAISKVPFNTFNLGASLCLLILMTLFVSDAMLVAAAFPISYLVLGALSEGVWLWRFRKLNT
jgi:O-antigen/teichoic acid export membrane protein